MNIIRVILLIIIFLLCAMPGNSKAAMFTYSGGYPTSNVYLWTYPIEWLGLYDSSPIPTINPATASISSDYGYAKASGSWSPTTLGASYKLTANGYLDSHLGQVDGDVTASSTISLKFLVTQTLPDTGLNGRLHVSFVYYASSEVNWGMNYWYSSPLEITVNGVPAYHSDFAWPGQYGYGEISYGYDDLFLNVAIGDIICVSSYLKYEGYEGSSGWPGISPNGDGFISVSLEPDAIFTGKPVPLPPTALLLGSGLLGLAGWRRLRKG